MSSVKWWPIIVGLNVLSSGPVHLRLPLPGRFCAIKSMQYEEIVI